MRNNKYDYTNQEFSSETASGQRYSGSALDDIQNCVSQLSGMPERAEQFGVLPRDFGIQLERAQGIADRAKTLDNLLDHRTLLWISVRHVIY
jgi:hypothetical protein